MDDRGKLFPAAVILNNEVVTSGSWEKPRFIGVTSQLNIYFRYQQNDAY